MTTKNLTQRQWEARQAQIARILRKPYTRMIIPDEDTGTFTAEMLEFPGCVTQGDTVDEAYDNLSHVAAAWLDVLLDQGDAVPGVWIEQQSRRWREQLGLSDRPQSAQERES